MSKCQKRLVPLRMNSTNGDREIFHCTAPAEAGVDQTPCRRPILESYMLSFYFSLCSASWAQSPLCSSCDLGILALKSCLEIKCVFASGFVAVLQLSAAVK